MKAGAFDFLEKPYEDEVLLRRSRPRSPPPPMIIFIRPWIRPSGSPG